MASRPASRSFILISAAAAIGAAILYRFDPSMTHIYPPCMFHMLTGWQCPGCGATRAVYHLLHGDLAGAFRFNPLLFAAAPFGAVAWRWPEVLKKPSVAWAAVVVITAYGIVRNLPFWPYPL